MLAFDKFFENKTLMFSAGAVAFLVAALLILFIFRLAFGRRLHMPGSGRARQPRLGVVDAFDLDRQRQLVLVRRDNVEHLVMIGGPNDVLIESQIVRVEAREQPRSREKEPTIAAPLNWPVGQVQSPVAPPAIPAEPKLVPEEPAGAARQAAQAAAVPPSSPPPAAVPTSPAQGTLPARPPFLPLPPRRPLTTPPPSFGFKPAPTVGPAAEGASADAQRTIVAPQGPRLPGAAPTTAPSFLRPRPPGSPAPQIRPVPPAATEMTESAGQPVVPIIPPEPPKSTPLPKANSMDALESLEEEMAKLLGRNTKTSDSG